jgi:hypothetical protein
MRNRCERANDKQYKDYGGRGIKVCEQWKTFAHFLEDMGLRPEGTTLDRIDNDGDYTLDNCRWANRIEQGRNRRDNRMVVYAGKQMTLVEACQMSGIRYDTARSRLDRYGWTAERTFAVKQDARGQYERTRN